MFAGPEESEDEGQEEIPHENRSPLGVRTRHLDQRALLTSQIQRRTLADVPAEKFENFRNLVLLVSKRFNNQRSSNLKGILRFLKHTMMIIIFSIFRFFMLSIV